MLIEEIDKESKEGEDLYNFICEVRGKLKEGGVRESIGIGASQGGLFLVFSEKEDFVSIDMDHALVFCREIYNVVMQVKPDAIMKEMFSKIESIMKKIEDKEKSDETRH